MGGLPQGGDVAGLSRALNGRVAPRETCTQKRLHHYVCWRVVGALVRLLPRVMTFVRVDLGRLAQPVRDAW